MYHAGELKRPVQTLAGMTLALQTRSIFDTSPLPFILHACGASKLGPVIVSLATAAVRGKTVNEKRPQAY